MEIAKDGQFQFTPAWGYVSRPTPISKILIAINKDLKVRGLRYTEEALLEDFARYPNSVVVESIGKLTFYKNKGAVVIGFGKIKTTNWKSVLEKNFSHIDTTDPDFSYALTQLMDTTNNVCLVGPGGSGKSVLVQLYHKIFPNIVVLATTGAAAEVLRDKGIPAVTIHSFLRLPPEPWFDTIPEGALRNKKAAAILRTADAVIIDEVSMLSANTMDIVLMTLDALVHKNIRIILVGDPLQLPPVVNRSHLEIWKRYETGYGGKTSFFASPSFIGKFKGAKLTKIYRQSDPDFGDSLTRVRNGTMTDLDLAYLSSNVKQTKKAMLEPGTVVLCSTNAAAKKVNDEELKRLSGTSKVYEPITFPVSIFNKFGFTKEKTGIHSVELKIGSLVMCTINQTDGGAGTPEESLTPFEIGYYTAQNEFSTNEVNDTTYFKRHTFVGSFFNGSIGNIVDMHDRHVVVRLTNGDIVSVGYVMRYELEYYTDPKTKKLKTKQICAYEQLGVIPARALTIHKSQGKTLPKVHVEIPPIQFTSGLLYVALSRVETLEGLSVTRQINTSDIAIDTDSAEFLESRMFEHEIANDYDLE